MGGPQERHEESRVRETVLYAKGTQIDRETDGSITSPGQHEASGTASGKRGQE